MTDSKFLTIVFSSISILVVLSTEGNSSFMIELTFLLIMLISIFGVFSRSYQPYSIFKIVFLFSFFFFGIAPFLQFKTGIDDFFGARHLRQNEYLLTNFLVIIILLSYWLFYYLIYQTKTINNRVNNYDINFIDKRNTVKLIFFSLLGFTVFLYLNNFNILSLFVRGGAFKDSIKIDSSAASLFISKVFEPMMMVSLLFYLSSINKKKWHVVFLLFILTILGSSPTRLARFATATVYIPLFIYVFPILRKKNIFNLSFMGGLLIIFPFLNNFRRLSEGAKLRFSLDFNMFTEGHFDSYRNLALVINENIITNGKQLMGVFLFWVPRSIWPSKPIGSGHFIAKELNMTFSNISMNFFGEGYINFGFAGTILFIILLAYSSAVIDKTYWEKIRFNKGNLMSIVYLFIIGISTFIMRGDLLSSFAYSVGYLVSILIIFKFVKTKKI